MSNVCIENLISMMENDKITKDELLFAMNQIQFNSSSSDSNAQVTKIALSFQSSPKIENNTMSTNNKSKNSLYLYNISHSGLNFNKGIMTCKPKNENSKSLLNVPICSNNESFSQNPMLTPTIEESPYLYTSPSKVICETKPDETFDDFTEVTMNPLSQNYSEDSAYSNLYKNDPNQLSEKKQEDDTSNDKFDCHDKRNLRSYSKNEPLEYTFHPKIERQCKKIQRTNKSLLQSRKKINDLSKFYTSFNTSSYLSNFYNRQRIFEQKRKEHKQKILDEIQINPNPQIDKKSKEIASTMVDFEKRNQILLNRNENYIMKYEKYCEKECSFKPNILSISKNIKTRGFNELSYASILRKEASVNRIKKKIGDQEAKECPFHPNIEYGLYTNVNSKLKLRDDLNTLTKRIEIENAKKTNIRKLHKKHEEDMELRECTHAPKINKFPHYIKKPIMKRSNTSKERNVYSKSCISKK